MHESEESSLRLVDLESLSAADLQRAIQEDPVARDRLLRYADDRGEVSDRQWDDGQVSSAILAAVAGVSERTYRLWIAGNKDFPIAARRAVIAAAWMLPAES